MSDAQPKAQWLSAIYDARINGCNFQVKVSMKGFIGIYAPDETGTLRYEFGLNLHTAEGILGAEHPAVQVAGKMKADSKITKQIARDAARELTKQALNNPEMLEAVKALLVKKVS